MLRLFSLGVVVATVFSCDISRVPCESSEESTCYLLRCDEQIEDGALLSTLEKSLGIDASAEKESSELQKRFPPYLLRKSKRALTDTDRFAKRKGLDSDLRGKRHFRQSGGRYHKRGLGDDMRNSKRKLGDEMRFAKKSDVVNDLLKRAEEDSSEEVEKRGSHEDNSEVEMRKRGIVSLGKRGIVSLGKRGIVSLGKRGIVSLGKRGIVSLGKRGIVSLGKRGIVSLGKRSMYKRGMVYLGKRRASSYDDVWKRDLMAPRRSSRSGRYWPEYDYIPIYFGKRSESFEGDKRKRGLYMHMPASADSEDSRDYIIYDDNEQ